MRADVHDGPGHNTLQSEAGYIDARPQSRQTDETSCDARPDHTNGSKCEELKVRKASLQYPNDQTLLAGARNFAEDQFRTKALAETVALALRRLRFGPPTLAGYLFGPAIYEVEATGSEMVQWTPSPSKAKVVRAPN